MPYADLPPFEALHEHEGAAREVERRAKEELRAYTRQYVQDYATLLPDERREFRHDIRDAELRSALSGCYAEAVTCALILQTFTQQHANVLAGLNRYDASSWRYALAVYEAARPDNDPWERVYNMSVIIHDWHFGQNTAATQSITPVPQSTEAAR